MTFRSFSHGAVIVDVYEESSSVRISTSGHPAIVVLEVVAHDIRRALTMALDAIARDHGHTLAEMDNLARGALLVCVAGTCCRPRGHAGAHDQFDAPPAADSLKHVAIAAGCVRCGAKRADMRLLVTDIVEAFCPGCR